MADDFDWTSHLPPEMGKFASEVRVTGHGYALCAHILGTRVEGDQILIDRCGKRISLTASWCPEHAPLHPAGEVVVSEAKMCHACGGAPAFKYELRKSNTRRAPLAVMCKTCSTRLAKFLAPLAVER